MIGLRTEFNGFGNFQNPFPLPAPGPATNYTYTNGSVLVDSTGNAGGLTTFWSYNNNAQYNPAGTGSINYTALGESMNNAGHTDDSNIAAAVGFELHGYRDLGTFTIPGTGTRAIWGLRTGFQYARVDFTNRMPIATSLSTINDSFDLGGAIPFLAPFTGPFTGPSTLLSDTPTRTLSTTNALIGGSRRLNVNLFVTSIGNFLEIPIFKKVDLMLEGGFLLAIASGSYDFNSSVSVPGSGTQVSSGHSSRTRLLPGFYTGLGFSYCLTARVNIQASARYQFMRQFDLIANGSNAALNFDSAFVLSLSTVYKF